MPNNFNRHLSNTIFILFLILINFSYSLKSKSPNFNSEITMPAMESHVAKKEIKFLNLMQQTIQNSQKDEIEEIHDFYVNYEDVKKSISKEFETKFGFCKDKVESAFNSCNKNFKSVEDSLAFNKVSAGLYKSSQKIVENYLADLQGMNETCSIFRDFFNILEGHNSLDDLMDSASLVFASYKDTEDKYNIKSHPAEEQPKDKDEISKEVLNVLKNDKELEEDEAENVLLKYLPNFNKDKEFMDLIDQLPETSNFRLDREAYGQMCFDKLSWYLDYNTKREEELLEQMEMMKLQITDTELKIQKLMSESKEMIADREGSAEAKNNEANNILEDYYSCKGIIEVKEKCDETKSIFERMTAALDLETAYYDKVKEIVSQKVL